MAALPVSYPSPRRSRKLRAIEGGASRSSESVARRGSGRPPSGRPDASALDAGRSASGNDEALFDTILYFDPDFSDVVVDEPIGYAAQPRTRAATQGPGRAASTSLHSARSGYPSPTTVAAPRQLERLAPRVRRHHGVLPMAATAVVLAGAWLGVGVLRGGAPSISRLAGSTATHGSASYVVRPGDTLWSIATRLEPTGDPRPLVSELAAQLRGGTLVVGETLHLP